MVVVAHESSTGPDAVMIDRVFEKFFDGIRGSGVVMGATREVA
jgi:hypothetical protein